MTSIQIQCFLTAAKLLSFTKAAEECNGGQSLDKKIEKDNGVM